MPLINLTSDLKSLRYGNDRPSGDSAQPYIQIDIDTGLTGIKVIDDTFGGENKSDDGFIRGGAVNALKASLVDAVRIGKFFTDLPKGPLFIAKQVGLQLTNPRLETRAGTSGLGKLFQPTRLYNLGINTLAQTAVSAFGIHFNRHGVLPVQSPDTLYENIAANNNFSTDNRLVKLAQKFFDFPGQGPTRGIFTTNEPIDKYIAGPGSVYGVGNTIIKRYSVTNYGDLKEAFYKDMRGLYYLKAGKKLLNSDLLNNDRTSIENTNGLYRQYKDSEYSNYHPGNIAQLLEQSPKIAITKENFLREIRDTYYVKAGQKLINGSLEDEGRTSAGAMWSTILDVTQYRNTLEKSKQNAGFFLAKKAPTQLSSIAGTVFFNRRGNESERKGISQISLVGQLFNSSSANSIASYPDEEGINSLPSALPVSGSAVRSYEDIKREVDAIQSKKYALVGNKDNDYGKNIQFTSFQSDSDKSTGAYVYGTGPVQLSSAVNVIDEPNYETVKAQISKLQEKLRYTVSDNQAFTASDGKTYTIRKPTGFSKSSGIIGRRDQDSINRTPIFEEGPYFNDTQIAIGDEGYRSINDSVILRIQSVNSDNPSLGKWITFRSYITSFGDDTSANWTDVQYVGRGDKFYIYGGFTRTINLGFRVAAFNPSEMIIIYQKLNYLMSNTMPDYGGGIVLKGPLSRMTVGNWIDSQLGIINSIGYTVPDDSPWETGDKLYGYELPHIVDVKMTFTPIGVETGGANRLNQKSLFNSNIAQLNTLKKNTKIKRVVDNTYYAQEKGQGNYVKTIPPDSTIAYAQLIASDTAANIQLEQQNN